jgi:hypothetical protein
MLCPDGCGVQQVVNADENTRRLECGHERTELLTVKPDRISVEHLRTEEGKRLFPASLDGELTAQRTRWIEK